MSKPILGTAVAAALCLPLAAFPADKDDVAEIRRMMEQMKQDYEARLSALEQRLQRAETAAAQAGEQARQAEAAATQPAPAAAAGANAFNPEISLILSGLYGAHSRDPDGYSMPGFHLPAEVLEETGPHRGLGLAESELGIYANVDPWFYGGLNLALTPDNSVAVEEAFVQTTALSHGFTLKAGRFFSGIGYLNEHHAHTWDFVDVPLAYQAFLGGKYGDDGLELRWLAPTDLFLELGALAGRGAGYPGGERERNGIGAGALFAHLGGDLGDSHNWRLGLSWLATSPRDREWEETDGWGNDVVNDFSGNSRLWILDGIWKWAPHGNARDTAFTLQAEYLYRTEKGDMRYDLDGSALPSRYDTQQSGWYLQGVYRFARNWRVGLRTERLHSSRLDFGLNDANLLHPDHDPSRHTLMIDYSPSEFSRLRLQLARDHTREGEADNQLFLQYLMALGAHGAHKF